MLTNPNTYSPGLIAILANHREAGNVSVKELFVACDTSYSTAERIFDKGWEAFERIQRMLGKLQLPVAHDIATELVGKRFTVGVRDVESGQAGVCGALKMIKDSASLALEIEQADSDGHRTADEAARIVRGINEIRAMLDKLEQENRPRMRTAG